MSWIMTDRGWQMLVPTCVNRTYERMGWDQKAKAYVKDDRGEYMFTTERPGLPSSSEERSAYDGAFPSERLCDFVNSIKDKMINFDDGERMKYSRYGNPPVVTNQRLTSWGM